MIEEYINRLSDLVFNPLLFVGLIITFVFINAKRYDLNARWLLVALLALVSSFAEFKNEYVLDTPDLVFPLEPIRLFGRPIAILLLILLMVFIFWFRLNTTKVRDWLNIRTGLLLLQLLIFMKNLFYGNAGIAVLVFLTFLMVYAVFENGVSKWLNDDDTFKKSIYYFIIAVTTFNLMGFYQSLFDFYPMIFQQGRYMGMTGNPQHAAVLLGSSVPLFVFFIIDSKTLNQKILYSVLLLMSLYYLILSGSRTGMLEAVICILVFVVGFRTSSIKWIVMAGIVIVAARAWTTWEVSEDVNQNIEGYTTREMTRALVFARQLEEFSRYPVFGAPVRGERMGYTENSYGAVAASLGVIGLIPFFFMLRGLITLLFRSWRISQRIKEKKHHYLLVVSGIFSLMVGAFLEAYLLGNLTWPLILLLTYVSWGYYLLHKYESENQIHSH